MRLCRLWGFIWGPPPSGEAPSCQPVPLPRLLYDRPGACLKKCVSPSKGIYLIRGTRMHMTPEPISGFALSSPFLWNKTGGRRWTMGIKASALGVPSWLHLGHIDKHMWRKAHSSTRRMPCVITVISQEPGRRLFLTNRRASRRWVWSVLMARSAHVWTILGAQAQTRSNIVKTGTGFNAQKISG